MHERKGFWDKNAGRYNRFMRNDRAAYEKMHGLIRPVVKAKTVLEVATGSALLIKLAFNTARKYPDDCKMARIDIDRRLTRVICDWRDKQ